MNIKYNDVQKNMSKAVLSGCVEKLGGVKVRSGL
jgi:hypothetical protein